MEYKKHELSTEEMRKFLDNLENDDADLVEAHLQMESGEKGETFEEDTDGYTPEEMMNDQAWGDELVMKRDENGKPIWDINKALYTDLYARLLNRNAKWKEAKDEKRRQRKLRRIEIQREAMNSKVINIYDNVSKNELKMLITLLTKDYSDLMDKCKKYIDKRLTQLLRPYIPNMLKQCKGRYPDSMIEHPGFVYVASKEFGKNLLLWVNPDIPYYFAQGTEMELLREHESKFLFAIDKAVAQYDYNKKLLSEKEVKFAVRLRSCNTFYDLVKINPFWYDILMQYIVKNGRIE